MYCTTLVWYFIVLEISISRASTATQPHTNTRGSSKLAEVVTTSENLLEVLWLCVGCAYLARDSRIYYFSLVLVVLVRIFLLESIMLNSFLFSSFCFSPIIPFQTPKIHQFILIFFHFKISFIHKISTIHNHLSSFLPTHFVSLSSNALCCSSFGKIRNVLHLPIILIFHFASLFTTIFTSNLFSFLNGQILNSSSNDRCYFQSQCFFFFSFLLDG